MQLVVYAPIGDGFSIALDIKPSCPLWKLKHYICNSMNLKSKNLCFVQHGNVISEEVTLGDLKMGDSDVLGLMPLGIFAAIDEAELIEEYNYLRTQFPLVKMVDLMTYTGKLRCERGYVKDLADRGVWPFVEYVKWHEFKMTLSYLHPYKPPSVTWLTDISHPNIIAHKKGKVCVSILGKKWLPNTKLAAVINALYFLLSDPNPYSAYKTKKCQEVAKICRMFGFPIKRG
ncbi:MAG: hypothetical protein JSW00_08200 [Thermoplasmata archaeon]|nr:MAG: hypothetical protein JSW00_08200 [Thermoplasmata archaeon]